MHSVCAVADRLAKAAAFLAGIALILMMVHVTIDVACNLLNIPIMDTIEIVSNYYIVIVVFLPLAFVELRNEHIHVELLTSRLPRKSRRLLASVVYFSSATFMAVITWATWLEAVAKYRVGEYVMGMLALTVWPARFVLPIGCGLFALVLVLKGITCLSGTARTSGGSEGTGWPGAA